ncbi:beta-ketoacyl synthase N-terminal-like domain-containing protein [Paraliobacillus sp. JSM ZJ581]|uniref:beta-ketoacyl synthase N-terminal-like domain-containing protein n=1 Tax=Paraliobacillus sp. JSM ZJ581 TaxID=3342118 RepID=UPI0035A96947
MDRSVVITGRGVLGPDIESIDEMDEALNQGSILTNGENNEILMGIVKADLNMKGYFKNRKVRRFLSRSEKFATIALKQAFQEANINEGIPSYRKGIFLGNTKESGSKADLLDVINEIYDHNEKKIDTKAFAKSATTNLSPLFVVEALPNACLHYFSAEYGINGENSQFMNNNVASLQALNEAFNSIVNNESDVVIAGGFDSYSEEGLYKVLSDRNIISKKSNQDQFQGAFAKYRTAPFLSEGAGMFILEEKENAIKRNTTVYGEIVGFKQLFINKTDSEQQNQLHLKRALIEFLERVKLKKSDIQVIHFDASSSNYYEGIVSKVVLNIFSDSFFVDTKLNFGSMIGANSAIALLSLLLILEKQQIPHIPHAGEIDELFKNNIVFNKHKSCNVQHVMLVSSGFEGEIVIAIVKKF